MEYLIQKEEHHLVARLIPLAILFFCLLRSFGLEARKYSDQHFVSFKNPHYVIDTATPFNERVVWLQVNKRGFVDICFRDMTKAPKGFNTPAIISLPARQLTCNESECLPIKEGSICFTPQNASTKDQIILCQDPSGVLKLFNYNGRTPDRRPRPKRLKSEQERS